MAKVIPRKNRILRMPKELWNTLDAVAYFQSEPINTKDFIIEILMYIAKSYGDKIQKETVSSKEAVDNLLSITKMLNNPEDNNRFFEGIST